MADTQASAFGDIPALDLTNDRIPILDVSATGNDKNKLISPTNLMVSKLDLTGGTLTGGLTFNLAAGNYFDGKTGGMSDMRISSGQMTLGRTAGGTVAQLALIGTSGSGGNRTILLFDTGSPTIGISSAGKIGFSSTADGGGVDTLWCRDGAGIMAQKNGTTAQKLRVYGTTTGSKYLQLHHEGDTGSGMGLITTSTGKLQLLGNDGVQLGSSGSSYIGFYGATPGARPGTGVSEAAFVENAGGTAVNTDSTFGGYTLQQLAQALQNLGLIDP